MRPEGFREAAVRDRAATTASSERAWADTVKPLLRVARIFIVTTSGLRPQKASTPLAARE